MQIRTQDSGKRLYTAPRLTMHGTLEDITKQGIKFFGASDGWALSNEGTITPIGNVS
jgi:hypothetical protein